MVIAAKAGSDCTVSDAGLVHITGAGTCIVIASQPRNTNYVAAPDKEHTIPTNQATITTVTWGAGPFTYAGSAITTCSARVTGSGALNQSLTLSYQTTRTTLTPVRPRPIPAIPPPANL